MIKFSFDTEDCQTKKKLKKSYIKLHHDVNRVKIKSYFQFLKLKSNGRINLSNLGYNVMPNMCVSRSICGESKRFF